MSPQNQTSNRRPLKVRGAGFAKSIATLLCRSNVTPNQISILSVAFAILAGIALYATPKFDFAAPYLLPTLAAVFIQCRLLCNLFDGMVAVEGGKGTQSGELFNDIPDRFADPIIIVALGFAAAEPIWVLHLAWLGGLLSIMTAYIRTLSASIGAPVDFQGPMAKQHRMAVVTVACLLWGIERMVWQSNYTLVAALALINFGCLITIYRRIAKAYQCLESQKKPNVPVEKPPIAKN